MNYSTLITKQRGQVSFVQLNRPDASNAINAELVAELTEFLNRCKSDSSVVVLEGLSDSFCVGADFSEVVEVFSKSQDASEQTAALYDLWLTLATGPFVSIAHVKGKAMAGGVGFVAACDIAIADEGATFSLPEMIFGLLPAAVLPFLTKRTGAQNAHLMTLLTDTLTAAEAKEIGLVDVVSDNSNDALRRQLLRVQRLGKTAIERYKNYRIALDQRLAQSRPAALKANFEVFSDLSNIESIEHFNATGQILSRGSTK